MRIGSNEHAVVDWIPGNRPVELILDGLIVLCIVLVVFGSTWLQSVNPDGDWFMRSGAIVVLLGAVLEYRHNTFVNRASSTSIKWASGVGAPVIFELKMARKIIGYTAHVCIVVGTFIAAYGDLILGRVAT